MATLLDFTADDGPDLGFAYVLPLTRRSALVMAVRMGEVFELLDPLPAVPSVVNGVGWRVVAEETGVASLLPPPPRRLGHRILAIGRRSERVRPSTGYAVSRILADSVAIRTSLDLHGHPFAMPRDPWSDRALDAVWCAHLLAHGPISSPHSSRSSHVRRWEASCASLTVALARWT